MDLDALPDPSVVVSEAMGDALVTYLYDTDPDATDERTAALADCLWEAAGVWLPSDDSATRARGSAGAIGVAHSCLPPAISRILANEARVLPDQGAASLIVNLARVMSDLSHLYADEEKMLGHLILMHHRLDMLRRDADQREIEHSLLHRAGGF